MVGGNGSGPLLVRGNGAEPLLARGNGGAPLEAGLGSSTRDARQRLFQRL